MGLSRRIDNRISGMKSLRPRNIAGMRKHN